MIIPAVMLILSLCLVAYFAIWLCINKAIYRGWAGFFLCLNIVNASYSACKLFGG